MNSNGLSVRVACLAAVMGMMGLAGVQAADAPVPKAEPELAPDTNLLARIEALPDNTWLKLPPCKTTGDMGVLNKDPDYKATGPRIRDYCNKIVWAPERKRGLYCGGGHNVHPYNDVWEYDLAANTWICLYGADPAPAPGWAKITPEERVEWYKKNAVFTNGVVRTPRGAPLRPCHTWWSLAYDSTQKRLLFLESHKGFFGVDKGALSTALGIDPKDPLMRTYGSGPGEAWLFTFHPETRQWQAVYTNVPKTGESLCLEYLPDQQVMWWMLGGKTYRRDAVTNDWVAYPASKDGPGHGAETAYDPETRQVVATMGLKTCVFSCDTGLWKVAQTNALDGGCVPHSTFCYDSAAKRFVLYTFMKLPNRPEGVRLRLYDHRANEWTDPKPPGEAPKMGGICYYDAARNVTVIYSNREMWVYRCKREKAK